MALSSFDVARYVDEQYYQGRVQYGRDVQFAVKQHLLTACRVCLLLRFLFDEICALFILVSLLNVSGVYTPEDSCGISSKRHRYIQF